MSVEDSEFRRFELTFGWVFLTPILAQDVPRNYFFGFFLIVWDFFFEDLCSSRAVQKSFGGYLWNSNFFWQHRVSIVTGLKCQLLFKNTQVLTTAIDRTQQKRNSAWQSWKTEYTIQTEFGGGTSSINADFFIPRFLETTNSDFVVFCAIGGFAKIAIFSSVKLDSQDISFIPSETEKSLILIGKTILN